MSWKEEVVDLLTLPWVIASAVAAGLLNFAGLGGFWEFGSGVAMELFAPIAIAAGTIAPNVDWIPTNSIMGLLVGIAIVVFIVKMDSAIESIRNRYS